MAFTGYPDGKLALSELLRVLRPQGRLVMVDVTYPNDAGNLFGRFLTNVWKACGDIVRDMPELFAEMGITNYTDRQIGGFGSVHLYVVTKH